MILDRMARWLWPPEDMAAVDMTEVVEEATTEDATTIPTRKWLAAV